ncbi:hypothetical protein A2477_00795 [Candidatus Falkowbacteria bacterium RIFOXYC2_FULL_47_12]|uniref:Pilus assembly protein PilO n=2 Tax=Candidatus Falkowiibacteriota TaxID=1752728 RepID=A0A1F5TQG0_9BACT|nr:MAG: hypothetical protein A2242_04705 [Candidatus Falkowbacteria bacterium RIFOXYA2_FULL_47_9]OGF40731.1 MAG: hypothetical protein A2477_00795 [Candidatus Falkowbacteria bacterium RIFOXYC2_FULL_47_12]
MEVSANQNDSRQRPEKKSNDNEQRSAAALFFQRYFYYTVGIEVIVVALLGYGLAVKPQLDAISAWQAQARTTDEQMQTAMAQTEKKSADLQRLLDAYNSISAADLAAINALVPEREDLETLFFQLNAMAKQNGIFVTAIALSDETAAENMPKRSRLEVTEKAPADAAAGAGPQTINLTIKVSGAGYAAFKNFLAALEQNARLLDVQEVSYDPKSEAAEITLQAYYVTATPAP